MKVALSLLLSFTVLLQVHATAQRPDKITYNGEEYSLHSNPLEDYFEKYPKQRPGGDIWSTSLSRRYVATFELREKQLFLKDIEALIRDTSNTEKFATKMISVRKEIFPNEKDLEMDWFSGLLVLPYGKLLTYVHGGYASTFENYIILEINKGQLVAEKKLTGPQYKVFKEKQFQMFKKTDAYKKQADESRKYGAGDSAIEFNLKEQTTSYMRTMTPDDES